MRITLSGLRVQLSFFIYLICEQLTAKMACNTILHWYSLIIERAASHPKFSDRHVKTCETRLGKGHQKRRTVLLKRTSATNVVMYPPGGSRSTISVCWGELLCDAIGKSYRKTMYKFPYKCFVNIYESMVFPFPDPRREVEAPLFP